MFYDATSDDSTALTQMPTNPTNSEEERCSQCTNIVIEIADLPYIDYNIFNETFDANAYEPTFEEWRYFDASV